MDKWKATSRLTLNLGLRYDLQVYPIYGDLKDGTSAIGEIDFNNGTYILQRPVASCAATGNVAPCIPGSSLPANVVVCGRPSLEKHKDQFPTPGRLAYRLTDKMVLRASFGITDDCGPASRKRYRVSVVFGHLTHSLKSLRIRLADL